MTPAPSDQAHDQILEHLQLHGPTRASVLATHFPEPAIMARALARLYTDGRIGPHKQDPTALDVLWTKL